MPNALIEEGGHPRGRRYPYHAPAEGHVHTKLKRSRTITFGTPLDCALGDDALKGVQ